VKNPKFVCEKCGGSVYKSQIVTYPVDFPARKVLIGRVAVRVCTTCLHMMPTIAGKEKLNRCLGNVLDFYARAGVDVMDPSQKPKEHTP
jgi:hypothetical protein